MANKPEHINRLSAVPHNMDAKLQHDFSQVLDIINYHRRRVSETVDEESLRMVWEAGAYVYCKLRNSEWGSGVVRQLSEFIRTKDSTIKGWSYRTIYKMVQLYETYSTESFSSLLSATSMDNFLPCKQSSDSNEFVPFQVAQTNSSEFVPFQMAQIPAILLSIGWTNHQIILSRCKTDEERLFYILFAKKERLQNKQLERAIRTDTMASVLRAKDSQSAKLRDTYAKSPTLFKDTAYLDFLGLPRKYKETRLRKGIVGHMKEFILEVGKDFLFIDEEHPVKVGGKTYKVDLLFYHRLLQCMVAFELKTTEFRPSYQGQLEFYLEALDQEERRSNENPTIGIILCKESDMETVRFALNRSMSPMMIMQYKEQLKVGGVIQRSIEEYCKYINMNM